MELNIESALREIVEVVLPRWSDSHLGLQLSLDASYSYFGDKHRKAEFRREIRFLFQRPMNYTKVFVQVMGRDDDRYSKLWKLTCDHDSCWSSDGLRICHEVESQAMEFFRKKGIEWNDVHQYTSMGIQGPRLVLLKSRKPVGEIDKLRGLSYHRDWEIEIGRRMERWELGPRMTAEGPRDGFDINPDVLKAEGLVPDEMW
jgi:hypothetical protein